MTDAHKWDAWKKDREKFMRLLQDFDPESDVPVAIRVDFTREQARVMVGGSLDGMDNFEIRAGCSQFLENWLGPEMDRLHSHLNWKAMGGR